MNIIQDFIPLNTPHNRRPCIKRKIEYIVVHNTGNPTSTAKQERAWLTNKSNTITASYNYAVDSKDIIQCIPDDEVTWNAGDGRQGKGNQNGLSIEICESGTYTENEKNGIQLIVSKMIQYNLAIDKVKPHQFFSGKNCPRLILPRWNLFIDEIKFEYEKAIKPKEEVKPVVTEAKPQEHWAEKYHAFLISQGINISDKRFDMPMTRGDFFAYEAKKLGYKE